VTIQIDSREQERAIGAIKAEFERQKVKYFVSKLIVGDYMSFDNPRLIIDRKRNLSELVQNLGTDSGRFYREMKTAFVIGIKMIVLCEHGGKIKRLEDVSNWKNPMLDKYPNAMSGRELMERIHRISVSYGVRFIFCDKRNTGKKIIELLSTK
jgi:ERCC4-type nuclease